MKPFAGVLAAALILLPGLASAQVYCEKQWRAKYGHSCPAGTVFDGLTGLCIVTSG